ncbi:MAG TPA: NAD kinase [Actinomycetales bacterium]|nr:NAD kinase [Actinomycetales bacterium]
MMNSRQVLVVVHTGRAEAVDAAAQVIELLVAAGILPIVVDGHAITGDPNPVLEEALAASGTTVRWLGENEPAPQTDLVVVLGGDGTILRAAELVRNTGVPLLGINLGHVGFLAEREREDIEETVARVVEGDFEVEVRQTLDVTVIAPDGTTAHTWALNEATIEKAAREHMLEVVLGVDQHPLSSFGCDGVVVSTATGSTAHAFSAGGPVVWPDVDALLLVPLAAHALFARPIVVGPTSVLTIDVIADNKGWALLSCDGRRLIDLAPGTQLQIRRGQTPVRLARLSQGPFTERLVQKFDLPVVGWRGRRREI